MPPGWHSHKVRVANDIMIVNHERLGRRGHAGVRRRPRHLRRLEAGRAQAHRQVAHPRQGRASLRFRRPLRLYLADGRGLCRQHHDDPRSRRSRRSRRKSGAGGFPASGAPAARPIPGRSGWRRAATIPCASATASMSATGITASTSSTSPTCRSRRRSPASTPRRPVPAPHPHLPADAGAAEGPPHHGRGRRGRGQALAGGAGLHLDLRHHRRNAPDRRSPPSRSRAWTRMARRSRR